RIDIDDCTIEPPQGKAVDRGIEHGAILLFTCAQSLLNLDAFGDVLAQPGLSTGHLVCHEIECAAQSSELIAPPQTAARGEVAGGKLFGCRDELVGASSQ